MKALNCLVGIGAAAFALQATAEEKRSLDAHEHGHGMLNIAMEGDQIAIELEVPGFDIVGFEHDARSDADAAAVETALEQLSRPLKLFALPEAAGCTVVELNAGLLTDDGHDDEVHHDDHDDGDDHEEHHDGHEDEHGHDHDDHESEGEASHSEFHAEYLLACADIGSATHIDLQYFETFENAESLTVQLVTSKGATLISASRETPLVDLSETMGN